MPRGAVTVLTSRSHRLVVAVVASLLTVGLLPTTGSAQDPTTTTTTTATTTTEESAAPANSVVPAVVPDPGTTQSVITVSVGGTRSGTSNVVPQAGVTLQLTDSSTSTTGTTFVTPNTCVSDVDGDCSWLVTNTGIAGSNRDRQFWVRQITPPAPATFTNTQLNVGTNSWPATNYRFQTCPQLRGGTTCSSQQTGNNGFMLSTGTGTNASGGIWQTSAVNPAVPASCGLRVALIMDLSGSVGAALPNLKTAAQTFVNALVGTPSSVGLFTFASTGPATSNPVNSNNNVNRPLTTVSTQGGAGQVNGWIAGLSLPTGNNQFTNWDRALNQVTESAQPYDVAVMITDGSPTAYGNPATIQTSGTTRFREVENGVFSANGLKGEGTRIVAFGVGAGVNQSTQNLQSISGPTLNSDYFQTADYDAAGTALRALALGSCQSNISVIKQVIPPGGTIAQAAPAPGWTFGASTATSGVTVAPASGVTDQTGGVSFALTFPGGTASAPVTVNETQQAGYTLVQQGGLNATCRRLDTNATVTVTNSGATGFSVDALEPTAVSCTVYNQAPTPPATVQVDKKWVVNGTTYPDGQQPPGLAAALTINGTAAPFGVALQGFTQGQTISINESVQSASLPLCTVNSRTVTLANGSPPTPNGSLPHSAVLLAGANSYELTNVVTCRSHLELAKQVANGPALPTEWNLQAIAPPGALPGPSGITGVGADVTPDITYPLAESGGNPNYVQTVSPDAVLIPGSTGSWSCQQVGATGKAIPGFSDGLNGGVAVPLGVTVRCTATNQTTELILRKVVTNTHGGTATSDDWTLTATPTGTPPPGVVAQSVTGHPIGESIFVRPGQPYDLTETGPGAPGYQLESLECEVLPNAPAATTTITIQGNETGICTFTNVDQPAHLTLRKVVNNGTTGASAVPADWTLTATPDAIDGQGPVSGNGDPTSVDGVNAVEIFGGSYDLSESTVAGYTASGWSCTGGILTGAKVAVSVGATVDCTITNTAQPPHLTLVKTVDNGTGAGNAAPTAWTLSADGPVDISGQTGTGAVTNAAVQIGTYQLSEAGPGGYTASSWSCQGGTSTATSVTLALGESATCTINNTAIAPRLTLVKTVTNDNGGTALPTAWTLTATGPTTFSGVTGTGAVTDRPVQIGSYTLGERDGPGGYTAGSWTCVGAAVTNGNRIQLGSGAVATCTINNNDQPAALTLVKVVSGGAGGTTRVPVDWTLTATPVAIPGQGTVSGNGNPNTPGGVNHVSVFAGTYTLSEVGPAGFTPSAWTCTGAASGSQITVPSGGNVTCTITNTAIQPELTLVKVVDNGDGAGTASADDWTLKAASTATTITGSTGDDAVTDAPVTIGTYTLSETGPAGYTASAWSCTGAALTGTTLTVVEGTDATCTITNTAIAPTLTLIKRVVNQAGGAAVDRDWVLTADGPTLITGRTGDGTITDATVPVGTYTLTEAQGPAGYAGGDWQCTGASARTVGSVTLSSGQNVTCVIVNTDQPAELTLVKVVDDNDAGGSAVPADWTLTADGRVTISGPSGDDFITSAVIPAGSYDLTEAGPAGYTPGTWTCTGGTVIDASVVVPPGSIVRCEITNTAIVPTLTLVKTVTNDNGGSELPTAWTLAAAGPITITGATDAAAVTNAAVQAGTYDLSESGPAGYSPSAWTCDGATSQTAGTVTLSVGDQATCTINNDDQAAPPTTTPPGGEVAAADQSAGVKSSGLAATGTRSTNLIPVGVTLIGLGLGALALRRRRPSTR